MNLLAIELALLHLPIEAEVAHRRAQVDILLAVVVLAAIVALAAALLVDAVLFRLVGALMEGCRSLALLAVHSRSVLPVVEEKVAVNVAALGELRCPQRLLLLQHLLAHLAEVALAHRRAEQDLLIDHLGRFLLI